MDSQYHRLMFAVCVLNQEEDAHQILSDLLEEEGERALADWARAKKKSWHKRLDFVLGILPHLLTLRITCDFLANSLTILENMPDRSTYANGSNSESIKNTIAAINSIGEWAAGKEPNFNWTPEVLISRSNNELGTPVPRRKTSQPEDLQTKVIEAALRHITNVWPWRFGIMQIDLTMQSLHVAISSSRFVAGADADSNVHSATDASRNGCRKVVKATRIMLQHFGAAEMQRSNDSKYPHELAQWQIEHAIKVIENAND